MKKDSIFNKRSFMIKILIGVLLIIFAFILFLLFNKKDSKRFKEEYDGVSINNKFVYKDAKFALKTLKDGTGLIYFGFPECPWCQEYVKFLDEVANKNDIKEIYYVNILKDRKDNTKEYQEIVNILKDYLDKDDKGNPRIFVPHIVAVKEGKILDNDNETSTISSGEISTTDYWTDLRISNLKEKLNKILEELNKNICTTNCN